MKWIYAAFWVFIATMLIWQFLNYNHRIDQKLVAAGPQQQHFFFNSKSKDTTTMNPAGPDSARVIQADFRVESEQPVSGSFTCHVTLKNIGNKKATGVSVQVAPFQGVASVVEEGMTTDVDSGHHKLSSNAVNTYRPVPQDSQWISFPDMAPGQTLTKDAVFRNDYTYAPGNNPNPQIKFEEAP